MSAPSLLTKSCHDIDIILWLLCSPSPKSNNPPHLPSTVSSSGSLVHFKPSRKPPLAGAATNCFSCHAENECQYSAKKISIQKKLRNNKTGWPLNVAVPEINDLLEQGTDYAEQKVVERLSEDYTSETDQATISSRSWYGRCVYEADNDVCDNQVVNITWEDDFLSGNNISEQNARKGRGAKTATFHMVAFSSDVSSHRRTRIYGTRGEMVSDGDSITVCLSGFLRPLSKHLRAQVHDFPSGTSKTHHSQLSGGAHEGGDYGLARQFVLAIDAVKSHGMSVADAQKVHIQCTLEEVIRSHAFVFAADEARKAETIIRWEDWWEEKVQSKMDGLQV